MQALHEELGGLMNDLSDKITPEQFNLLNEAQEKLRYYLSDDFANKIKAMNEDRVNSLKKQLKSKKREIIQLEDKIEQLRMMLNVVI